MYWICPTGYTSKEKHECSYYYLILQIFYHYSPNSFLNHAPPQNTVPSAYPCSVLVSPARPLSHSAHFAKLHLLAVRSKSVITAWTGIVATSRGPWLANPHSLRNSSCKIWVSIFYGEEWFVFHFIEWYIFYISGWFILPRLCGEDKLIYSSWFSSFIMILFLNMRIKQLENGNCCLLLFNPFAIFFLKQTDRQT